MSSATFPDVQEGLDFLFEGSGPENTLAAGILRVQFSVFDSYKVFHGKTVGGAVYAVNSLDNTRSVHVQCSYIFFFTRKIDVPS